MLIDCDSCAARPDACGDCVVGVLLGTPAVPAQDPAPGEPAEPGDPLPPEFGAVELRALDVLADHGLIPRLRLVTSADPATGASTGPSAGRRARDAG